LGINWLKIDETQYYLVRAVLEIDGEVAETVVVVVVDACALWFHDASSSFLHAAS